MNCRSLPPLPKYRCSITNPNLRLHQLCLVVFGMRNERTLGNGFIAAISDFEKEISSSDWILFTSRNGVRAFFYNMKFNDTDIRCLAKIRFGVVGKATEQELKNYQIKADLVPDEQTGAGLAKALKKQISDQTKVCIFSAKEASEDLERELQKFCYVIKTDAYENVNVSEQDYILKPVDTVISEAVFTSASNVERFFRCCQRR